MESPSKSTPTAEVLTDINIELSDAQRAEVEEMFRQGNEHFTQLRADIEAIIRLRADGLLPQPRTPMRFTCSEGNPQSEPVFLDIEYY